MLGLVLWGCLCGLHSCGDDGHRGDAYGVWRGTWDTARWGKQQPADRHHFRHFGLTFQQVMWPHDAYWSQPHLSGSTKLQSFLQVWGHLGGRAFTS